MKKTFSVFIALVMFGTFALTTGCGGVDVCKCQEEALKGKDDQDADFLKKCETKFKDMSLDDLQKAMEKCSKDDKKEE